VLGFGLGRARKVVLAVLRMARSVWGRSLGAVAAALGRATVAARSVVAAQGTRAAVQGARAAAA
jgi:hypothetical protein